MVRYSWTICLAMFLLVGSGRYAIASSLQLFAAASTTDALQEIIPRFEVANVTVVTASSAALAQQIAAGAPADVVLLANRQWVDWLEGKDLLEPGTRVDLLTNRLVLIAPMASSITFKLGVDQDLGAALGDQRLALAETRGTPAGIYAKQALERLGLWTTVRSRAVFGQSVRVALAWVARGEAGAGIVYRSDALLSEYVRIVDEFPADTHERIVYPIAVVAGRSGARPRALQDFLQAAMATDVFRRHGFDMAVNLE